MNSIVDSHNDLKWLVYIIKTRQGKLYTGITNDLDRRTTQHKSGQGAKYFRIDPPVEVIWCETDHNRSSASQREAAIKKLSRPAKLALIKESNFTPIPI